MAWALDCGGQVIRIAGYVFEEKLAIANQYLIPSTMEENGVGRNLDVTRDIEQRQVTRSCPWRTRR